MFSSNTSQVSGGYEIQRSLRFNSADSAYLNRTLGSPTSASTWTLSLWFKRSSITSSEYQYLWSYDSGGGAGIAITSSSDANPDVLYLYDGSTINYSTGLRRLRDPSAWYHVVVSCSAGSATVYLNGSSTATISSVSMPNVSFGIASNIGRFTGFGGVNYFNGYMTEINFIDGQALTPSSFGAFDAQTGVWGPTPYAGSYGTNGFYLNFSDNSNTTAATLGKDYSGNGNNWTPNNFSVSAGAGNDSLVDVPTNWGTDTGVGGTVRGNYCTLNPLFKNGTNTSATLANGNLDLTTTGGVDNYFAGTFSVNSGKWYYECLVTLASTGFMTGICKTSAPTGANIGSYRNIGDIYNLDGTSVTSGATYSTNDLIGVAIDIDAGTVQFYKNGTAQGATPSFTFTAGTEIFVRGRTDGSGATATFNFGQRPFAYTAPSGFKALNTQNLPTPTIGAATATQANKYFDILTYTGTAPTPQTVTGLNFQPDFAWVKSRGYNTGHVLSNVLGGPTFTLSTDSTAAEYDGGTANITAFNSNGISVGTADRVNRAVGMVAWNWKANGAGVTNTQGTITSTVSANTTSGFSVVTYTGTGSAATVGHGLGAAAKMVIVKSRSNAIDWVVYHESIPSPRSNVLRLNLTDGALGVGNYWGSSGPTSTTFGLDVYGGNNTASATYVAYCFAEISGYSKFGSYTGNGSNSGPFVFCGFRPAYIMVKAAGAVGAWCIFDAKRNPSNGANLVLQANSSSAEGAFTVAEAPDLLSNGFRLNFSYGDYNANGVQYIFMAFAEAPQKFALAR